MKKFNVVHHCKYWFTLSGILVILSLASILMNGFNFGIDFTGGTILDVTYSQPVTVADVRSGLSKSGLETSVIQLSGKRRRNRAGMSSSARAICPVKKRNRSWRTLPWTAILRR